MTTPDPSAASSMQWATPILSFALGFVSAVFAEPLRQWLFRPRLALTFTGREDSITATRMTDGSGARYVRVKVVNAKRRVAKSCKGFLIKVEKRSYSGQFEDTNYVDSIQLAWSCQGGDDARKPLDLVHGISQYLDVVATSETSNSFALQMSPLPLRYEPLWSSEQNTYRYTVQVSGDGVDPVQIRIVFSWKGDWQNVDAYLDD
jgi:hypothetical protein